MDGQLSFSRSARTDEDSVRSGGIEARGALQRGGTIVDATLIAASRGGRGRALGGEGEGQTRRQADGPPACPHHRFGKVRAKVEHVFRVVDGMDRPRSRP